METGKMNVEPNGRKPRRRLPETLAGLVLLLALPAIVVGIYRHRRRGTPAPPPEPPRRRSRPPGRTAHAAPAKTADLLALLPRPSKFSPFRITTPPQQWPADKMHEKIDGEDGAYLKHGCAGLAAMTLTEAKSGQTIDVYLYQMSTPAAAAAVFGEQAPPEQALDPADRPKQVQVGDKAYTSYGCCYVRSGAYYLKLITGTRTGTAAIEALNLGRDFAEKVKERP